MTNFKPRPTTYKGYKMRSRLEAGFAQWLDSHGATWEYEPQCFASPEGQYLPDFLLPDVLLAGSRGDLYIEVKPHMGAVDLPTFLAWERIINANVDPARKTMLALVSNEHRWADTRMGFLWTADENSAVFSYCVWSVWRGELCLAQAVSAPWPDEYWKVGGA